MSTEYPIDPDDPGPTSEELFDRLQDPDQADAARNEILKIYYPFMHSAVHRISIPRQYHEQVISDVVESLAKYLKRFRYNKQAGRFRGYLIRCLMNAWSRTVDLECKRERSGFDLEFFDNHAPQHSLLSFTLEDEMRYSEASRALEPALAGMNPKHAAVARAVLLRGRDRSSVAEEFGITIANLYQILHRARQAIKKQLGDMDDWPGGAVLV